MYEHIKSCILKGFFKILYSHSSNKLQNHRFHKINTRPKNRERKNDLEFLDVCVIIGGIIRELP
ncbi:hypothetical protein C5S30_05975 [ANME-1 cluster archaeon GoMg4]|nr:hypothetical protein [ANME-1 cluster archaeon GoMg4]